MKPKVMLIGLGDLGGHILELLARENRVGTIIVGSRNATRAEARVNLVRLAAVSLDHAPQIRFIRLDLKNRDVVAETIDREKPNVILHTATMMTWWWTDLLPEEKAKALGRARFGVWLPVHLSLTLRLMETLKEIGYKGLTLTAPFPDVVNPVLGRLHLAPTCGVGNLEEIVPKVRLLASQKLSLPLEEIHVHCVAHHALESWIYGEKRENPPPFWLRILHGDEDVTESVNGARLLLSSYPLPPGPAINVLSAAATLRLLRGFLSKRPVLRHVPGPKGLPGGYPVVVSSQGVSLASLPDLTLEEAVSINERSHCFEGIECIEPDGTVVFCQEDAEVMKKILDYHCPRLHPAESESRAEELVARFRRYALRSGVNLPD